MNMAQNLIFITFLVLTPFLIAFAGKIKEPRLVNGETATKGQFPWQVGLVSVKNGLLTYCAGAIISEEWILTAAHCIYETDGVIVYYGTLSIGGVNVNRTVAENYTVHEEYENKTLKNDIGLVFLGEPLSFNDDIKAIALAEDDLETGTDVTVVGWGLRSDDDPNIFYNVLRYITVPTIDNEECTAAYGLDIIQPNIVCTDPGNPVKNPCKGDGGDPAVVNVDSNPTHVALFSFLSTYGCEDPDFPAAFTRTAYYRDWIRNLTGV